MDLPLSELAVRFGCELRGDPALRVRRVATLAGAGPGDLSFLANPQYRAQLAATRASAVVIDAASAESSPVAALVHSNPYATYARIAALLHPEPVAGRRRSPLRADRSERAGGRQRQHRRAGVHRPARGGGGTRA